MRRHVGALPVRRSRGRSGTADGVLTANKGVRTSTGASGLPVERRRPRDARRPGQVDVGVRARDVPQVVLGDLDALDRAGLANHADVPLGVADDLPDLLADLDLL